MTSRTRESWVMSMAGALLAAASAAAQESTTATEQPEVLKRPNTSSFAFASTFQGEDALRTGEWVLSEDKKYAEQESRVRIEPCDLEGRVFAADKGILLAESHKHYGLGSTFDKPVDNQGKDLVLQYEVQMRNGPNCGGAYVKMLRGEAGSDLRQLVDDSPYSIMFGPDKCFRDTNKVHFIFQHESPVTNEWEEKHFKNAPKIKDDKGFHVYTLHVKPDNTFDIYIDTESVSTGNLLEDFKPPVNPPTEIDDPEDEQPEDWVTEKKIPDPTAAKPDDWDEDAPRKIVDESAEMPAGWLEDAEEFIPDPESVKPDDWDDEEDGEWEPVVVPNPACDGGVGCGKWTKPMIKNPAYKGKWKAPMIDNPHYVGPWTPRKIPNPGFFEDPQPSNMAPITGLAVEIWSVDGGVWMDNFVVGHDISAALSLAEETWRPKFEAYEAKAAVEKKAQEEEKAKKKQKQRKESSPSPLVASSRALFDKARPYLPTAAGPALDMAGDSPFTCIGTLLVGAIGILLMTFRKRKATPPTRSAAPQMQNAASALPEVEEEEEEEQQQNAQGQADNDYDDDDHDDDEEEDGEEAAKEKDEPEPEVSASDGVVPMSCKAPLQRPSNGTSYVRRGMRSLYKLC